MRGTGAYGWGMGGHKESVRGGSRGRLGGLARMGIRTIWITGDNRLTAAAIAAEAGVDDFLAEATPEDKLRLIRQYQAEGRLVLAGPHPAIDAEDPGPAGFTGSLIVAEFATREAAIAWAAEDPYAKAGVYGKVTVKPFRKALPA